MKKEHEADTKDDLHKEMRAMTKELALSNSMKRKFLSAILYGFGTVVGATILVAILISILGVMASHGVFTGFNNWLVETIKN